MSTLQGEMDSLGTKYSQLIASSITEQYAALVAHKYRYLAAHGSHNLNEEMEGLVNIARIGIGKHPTDEAMQEAHQEILRAYLMLSVSEPTESAEDDTSQTSTE